MKTKFASLILLLSISFLHAGEHEGTYIRKGLIRTQLTISPGHMFGPKANTLSLHGNLEYYVADRISIRGSTYYLLQARDSKGSILDMNFSTFSGAAYHFPTSNRFDPYLSFEPGVAVVRDVNKWYVLPEPGDNALSVNPVYSSSAGFNYYFERWFHLFGEIRYIYGKHISHNSGPLSLSELRFSFGLGFNLNLIRQK